MFDYLFNDDKYIKVQTKFVIGHFVAILWILFSIVVSVPWLNDLSQFITMPLAILIIAGIAYIPGYINAFNVTTLLLDKQPSFKTLNPKDSITILIACYNEEKNISETVKYIQQQDYQGEIKVIIIDNASIDRTNQTARELAKQSNIAVKVLYEGKPGKNYALNTGLKSVDTELLITLDADTILHKSAVKHVVSRMKTAPQDVAAVAGAVLVRNSRENLITKLQEWDYFIGIASIKRMQGLFQGTLVAQGAYSLYKTKSVKDAGAWPDAIGEDIVLTWNFLKNNERVYFEPLAVAFTEVPGTIKHLLRQRSRWARGMFEALRLVKPWEQPINYIKYLTGINLLVPYLDIVYTFVWIPGLILAFFGKFWIVGSFTLLVLPLAFIQNYILYNYQAYVFEELDLKIRKNKLGYVLYILLYQMLMSPMSVWGYIQEGLNLQRVWK